MNPKLLVPCPELQYHFGSHHVFQTSSSTLLSCLSTSTVSRRSLHGSRVRTSGSPVGMTILMAVIDRSLLGFGVIEGGMHFYATCKCLIGGGLREIAQQLFSDCLRKEMMKIPDKLIFQLKPFVAVQPQGCIQIRMF